MRLSSQRLRMRSAPSRPVQDVVDPTVRLTQPLSLPLLFNSCNRNVLLGGCEKDARLVGCPIKQPKQAKEQPVDSIRESREADYLDDEGVVLPPPSLSHNTNFSFTHTTYQHITEEEEQIPEIYIKRKDFLAIVAGYLPLQQFTALPKHKKHQDYLTALGVPPTERIFLLLDTTFFGSCGVAFGSQGIYYCNSSFSQLQPGMTLHTTHYTKHKMPTTTHSKFKKESMGISGVWSFISCSHNSDK
jgi:hypothetical protein